MILSKLGRRMLAVAGSMSIGIVGALALASPAQAHHTEFDSKVSCPDPETGEWVVEWTIRSWADSWGDVTEYRILNIDAAPQNAEVTGVHDGWQPMSQPFTGEQRLSSSVDLAQITVTAEWSNGRTRTNSSHQVQRPADCDPGPVEIPIEAVSDCDSLTVTVRHFDDEHDSPGFEATVAVGDVTEVVTVGPGESEQVSFDAAAGTVATVTIGEESWEFPWEEPGDCDQPDNGEGGGDEELPLTGSPTLWIAGAAVALLVIGGGLFFVARRRGVSFTA